MKRGSILFSILIITVLALSFAIAEENNTPANDDSLPVTCDAYFEGYAFDSATNTCRLESASGCANPFKYSTKEECEKAEIGDLSGIDNKDSKEEQAKEKSGEDIYSDVEDIELKESAGLTPDSSFYFLDDFMEGILVGNSPEKALAYKEEKIAEAKQMIEEGKVEEAKKSLQNLKKYSEILEKEVSPEIEKRARESSKAVKEVLNGMESEIEGDEWEEVRGIVGERKDGEDRIAVTAKISSQISKLCKTLSELDPVEYSRVCRTEGDAPNWQKKLDKQLTDKQIEEAKKFGKIMSACFKTSGQDCKCDEIPFPDFAEACSKAAPLAIACDVRGDEEACKKLDSLKMPELPPHLQEVFDSLEGDISEAKYGMHMPQECIDAGVANPKECGKIMIETNAPEECKQALLSANIQNEREGREICDKIMMEKHAPDCAEKGITDPNECARFMDSLGGDKKMRPGPQIDFNCKEIKDSTERLECYDKASSQATGFKGIDDENYNGPCMTESDWRAKKEECKAKFGEHAGDEPIMGDSGDGYQCPIDAKCIDFGQYKNDDYGKDCAAISCGQGSYCQYGKCIPFENKEGYTQGEGCGDCSSKCPGSSRTDCINNRCECYYEDTSPQYSPGEGPGEPGDYDNNEEAPSSGGAGSGGSESSGTESGSSSGSSGGGGSDTGATETSEPSSGGGGSGSSESTSSSGSSGSEPSGSEGGGSGITGEVILNPYLDYYYNYG